MLAITQYWHHHNNVQLYSITCSQHTTNCISTQHNEKTGENSQSRAKNIAKGLRVAESTEKTVHYGGQKSFRQLSLTALILKHSLY